MVRNDDQALRSLRGSSPSNTAGRMSRVTIESQNVRSRSSLCSGRLPAISAALMPPIETPATQSGSSPASCSAW